jgi:HEAT repeat protein
LRKLPACAPANHFGSIHHQNIVRARKPLAQTAGVRRESLPNQPFTDNLSTQVSPERHPLERPPSNRQFKQEDQIPRSRMLLIMLLLKSSIRLAILLIAAASAITVAVSAAFPRLQKTSSDIEHLSAGLRSSDEQDRLTAVEGLSELGSGEAISLLISACSDHSERVRALAITKLGLLGDSRAVLTLTSALGADKKPFVRKSAAYALARYRTNEATSALSRALTDKDAEVRGAAAVTLADNPDPSSIPSLISALTDKSEFVRGQAARALGMNGKAASASVHALIELLSGDDDHEVKRQAATALGRIGDPSAVPALKQFIHNDDPYLLQSARDAIKMIEEVARIPSR